MLGVEFWRYIFPQVIPTRSFAHFVQRIPVEVVLVQPIKSGKPGLQGSVKFGIESCGFGAFDSWLSFLPRKTILGLRTREWV